MAVEHARVSVGTTATLLSTSVTPGASMPTVAHSVAVQSPSDASASVFIGGSGVTTSSYGFELTAGSAIAFDLAAGESIYAVVASGTETVNVVRLSV